MHSVVKLFIMLIFNNLISVGVTEQEKWWFCQFNSWILEAQLYGWPSTGGVLNCVVALLHRNLFGSLSMRSKRKTFHPHTFSSVCLIVTEISPYIYWWLQVTLSHLLFHLACEITSMFSDPRNTYEWMQINISNCSLLAFLWFTWV